MAEAARTISYGALGRRASRCASWTDGGSRSRCATRSGPAASLSDAQGQAHQLPRYFYEIPSWDVADGAAALGALRAVGVHPHRRARSRAAAHVSALRAVRDHAAWRSASSSFAARCGTYVHIAANGGYRSPAHALTVHATPHAWGTAVNIYRVGDTMLDEREALEHYAGVAYKSMPGVYVRPFGNDAGIHRRPPASRLRLRRRGAARRAFETYNPKARRRAAMSASSVTVSEQREHGTLSARARAASPSSRPKERLETLVRAAAGIARRDRHGVGVHRPARRPAREAGGRLQVAHEHRARADDAPHRTVVSPADRRRASTSTPA